jgi:hypothetical protein
MGITQGHDAPEAAKVERPFGAKITQMGRPAIFADTERSNHNYASLLRLGRSYARTTARRETPPTWQTTIKIALPRKLRLARSSHPDPHRLARRRRTVGPSTRPDMSMIALHPDEAGIRATTRRLEPAAGRER